MNTGPVNINTVHTDSVTPGIGSQVHWSRHKTTFCSAKSFPLPRARCTLSCKCSWERRNDNCLRLHHVAWVCRRAVKISKYSHKNSRFSVYTYLCLKCKRNNDAANVNDKPVWSWWHPSRQTTQFVAPASETRPTSSEI